MYMYTVMGLDVIFKNQLAPLFKKIGRKAKKKKKQKQNKRLIRQPIMMIRQFLIQLLAHTSKYP